jgi:ribokinase
MDLIATADRLPGRGESVTGGTFVQAPGGKGGNQAVQMALAGARVAMLTRLGDDAFGHALLDGLKAKGVDVGLVAIDRDAPTGASTVLAAEGDYSSIIAPGAAARLSDGDIDRAADAVAAADGVAVQLELPARLSARLAAIASAKGKAVILNASPAPAAWTGVPEDLWQATTMLVVNRVEAGRLLGRTVGTGDAGRAASDLAERSGAATVVVTMGPQGSAAFHKGTVHAQPAFASEVVDAVGAGDAFLGVFAVAMLEGRPVGEALRRAAAAGAIAVSRSGVYEALPTAAEVDRFLAGRAP